jgi:SAM-dependent methyltransferase
MSDRPQTWHFGLVARGWAEFNAADPSELAFYRGVVGGGGQPALDLGCGTGRLLAPLVQAGLDLDGCNVSPDMLALCREQAERSGLSPALYRQAFHELDLPRTYRTIYIRDSFGIGGHREHNPEALRRCHRHLAPGGTFVFSHDLPYEDADLWPYWLAEHRHHLPEAWRDRGNAQAHRR